MREREIENESSKTELMKSHELNLVKAAVNSTFPSLVKSNKKKSSILLQNSVKVKVLTCKNPSPQFEVNTSQRDLKKFGQPSGQLAPPNISKNQANKDKCSMVNAS